MIKVLYLHDQPSGGAGESLLQLVSENNKWKTRGVIFISEGYLKEKFLLLTPNLQVKFMKGASWLGSRFNNWIVFLLTRIVHYPKHRRLYDSILALHCESKFNIVHTNAITVLEGALAAAKLKIPHVVQVRELLDSKFYRYPINKRLMLKILCRYSKILIANSNRTQEVASTIRSLQ